MKAFKIIIPILILLGLAGGGYYLYVNNYFSPKTSDNQTTENETAEESKAPETPSTTLKNDDEYAVALGNIVMDYEDAYIQLAVIFNTDPENVPFETWDKWVKENLTKWEKIEKDSGNIVAYLEKQNPNEISMEFSLIPTARAQSVIPDKINITTDNINIPDQPVLINPLDTVSGEEQELDVGSKITPFDEEILQTAEGAPKNEQIKAIMQKFGFKDAKTAMMVLEQTRAKFTDQWKDAAASYKILSSGADTIKNASFTTVAVLGVIVSGGQIFTAATGAARLWAGVNTVFGGADLVLQGGEEVSAIIDNKDGQTYFKNGRENLKPINTLIGFINLKDGLIDGGNLVTVEGYGEAASDFFDQVNKDNANATPEQKQLFILNFGEGNSEATLGYDGNFKNPYENDPAKLMADLEKVLPKDSKVKINDTYVTIGSEEDMMKLMGIEPIVQPETPQVETSDTPPAETPAGPTPSGTFSGGFSFFEPIAKVTYNGVLNFTIGDKGTITGNTTITLNDTVTTQGIVTSLKGTGTAGLTGSFNNETLEINIGGNYSATGSSTTEGYTMKSSDSGTIQFTGLMTGFNVFTGKAVMQSNAGSTTSMDWTAQVQ